MGCDIILIIDETNCICSRFTYCAAKSAALLAHHTRYKSDYIVAMQVVNEYLG